MKKQYRHQKKITNAIIVEPKIEELPKKIPEGIIKENIPKKTLFHKITHDHAFPFIVIMIIFSLLCVSYGLWINHHELDKNITLKIITSSSGEYVIDECGDIYAYSPKGFGLIDIGDYYQADLIKYPNYEFALDMKTITNYHKINKSEYIKNCN